MSIEVDCSGKSNIYTRRERHVIYQLHGVAVLGRGKGSGEGLILAVADLRAIGLARVFADRPDVVSSLGLIPRSEEGGGVMAVIAVRGVFPLEGAAADENCLRLVIRLIEEHGRQNIYKLMLTGMRDPEVLFDLSQMDVYGNVVEIEDHTKPAYQFERLLEQNRENILGRFIDSLKTGDKESMEYQALCEGVQALMETRRG